MAEASPDSNQAQRDVGTKPARASVRLRMLARKVLEDRATHRQIQEMMHDKDTSQGSNRISEEIGTVKDLIVALGDQVAQLASELTATRSELTATKHELTANKNELLSNEEEMATKTELEALKSDIAAMIQTQLSNIQVPAAGRRHPTRQLLAYHLPANRVTFRPSPRGA